MNSKQLITKLDKAARKGKALVTLNPRTASQRHLYRRTLLNLGYTLKKP